MPEQMIKEMQIMASKGASFQICEGKKGKFAGQMKVSIWIDREHNHIGRGDTLVEAWNDALHNMAQEGK